MSASGYDVAIVGGGAAGATLALEFTRRGAKVVVLERGGAAPKSEGLLALAPVLDNVWVGEKMLTLRAFGNGGTTNAYFAVAPSPPLDLFKSLGVDLSDALDEAYRELPIAPMPDRLISAQAKALRDAALRLGYPWEKRPMLVDSENCSGYDHTLKWKAARTLEQARAQGAAIVNRARAQRVLIEDGRANGVEYLEKIGRKRQELRKVHADHVILASGASETPLLLRASGVGDPASSGFHCHPSLLLFATVRGLDASENFVGCMGGDLLPDLKIGDANFPKVFHRMLMLSAGQYRRMFQYNTTIGIGVMLMEELSGTLNAEGQFRKTLRDDELAKIAQGERVAREILIDAGGRNIFRSELGASHVGGTIVIGKDVDANLRTECANLHVCDASLIPAAARVPPTLSLICLGKYLARRIADDAR